MELLRQKVKLLTTRLKHASHFLASAYDGRVTGEFHSERKVKVWKSWSHDAFTAVFCLFSVVLLVSPHGGWKSVPNIQVGDVSDQDYLSPITAEIDPKETPQKQKAALAKKVAPVFDYDDSLTEIWIQSWEKAFNSTRTQFYPRVSQTRTTPLFDSIQQTLQEVTGQTLSSPDLLYLHQNRFSIQHEKAFVEIARQLSGRLISSHDLFHAYYSTGIVVRQLNQNLNETLIYDVSRIWSLDYARNFLSHLVNGQNTKKNPLSTRMVQIVNSVLSPNLKFNSTLTQQRIQAALGQVRTAPHNIKKGDYIVRRGDRITGQQAEILEALAIQLGWKTLLGKGVFYFVVLFIFFTILFRRKITRRSFWNLPLKDAMFFMGIILGHLLAAKYALPYFKLLLTSSQLRYGIDFMMPAAAGGIIIHLMMGKEAAYTFALGLSMLLGATMDHGFMYSLWTFAVCGTAIETIRSCKQRTDLYRSSLLSGIVASILALSFVVIQTWGLQKLDLISLSFTCGAAFLSGVFTLVLTNTLIPLLESLFGYTTNLKLLELSNFNHPLLHSLMMKAPGTYHHSVIVGSLAEVAADKVKANGLLARVSAYYHDIGKMSKALYFIENQAPHNNPHDHLAPSMSAKILFSHVKNGSRLGKEHNLGEKITDIIEQHHGTTLVSYFFNKAKKAVEATTEEVSENDFRYPGPKPQSREAAIVMISDACEAATRSISDPSPAKIETMVHNIINKRFLEEQFSDCDLTLNDLKIIGECITRTLVSLYHNRIEYPGQRQTLEAATGNKKNQSGHVG